MIFMVTAVSCYVHRRRRLFLRRFIVPFFPCVLGCTISVRLVGARQVRVRRAVLSVEGINATSDRLNAHVEGLF